MFSTTTAFPAAAAAAAAGVSCQTMHKLGNRLHRDRSMLQARTLLQPTTAMATDNRTYVFGKVLALTDFETGGIVIVRS